MSDTERPQEVPPTKPVVDASEKREPTPQGRADDDTDVRDDDGDTDIDAK